jgi:hypothetical protein
LVSTAQPSKQSVQSNEPTVAQQWFDALGASLYIAWYVSCPYSLILFVLTTTNSMVLETGIFASHAIWLWRVRDTRREAKKAGKSYDEYIAENPSKKLSRCESAETFVDVEAGSDTKPSDTYTEKTSTAATDAVVDEKPKETLQSPPAAVVRADRSG